MERVRGMDSRGLSEWLLDHPDLSEFGKEELNKLAEIIKQNDITGSKFLYYKADNWDSFEVQSRISDVLSSLSRQISFTADDFLDFIPVGISNHKKPKSNSTSQHVNPVSPKSIKLWTDFLENARNYRMESESMIGLKITRPFFDEIEFRESSEMDTQKHFASEILDRFNRFFREIRIHLEFGRHSIASECKGEPDFALVNSDSELVCVIEIKTVFTLDRKLISLNSLLSPAESSVRHIIEQLMGYMCHNRLKYALLSSFENTWFCYRDDLDLFFSPAVTFDSSDPTLFRCIGYFVLALVQNQHTEDFHSSVRHSIRISSDTNTLDSHSNTEYSSDVSVINSIPEDFCVDDLCDCIGNGYCGNVYKSFFRGEAVAVKLCDVYNNKNGLNALKNEVLIYEKLKPIQGDFIPRLVFFGESSGFFMVATTYIQSARTPDINECGIRNKLEEIEKELLKYGVRHGDLRKENIIIDAHEKVHVIDFSHSEFIRAS